MSAVHEAGVYHRDIRPENIFISSGFAYLGNFGKSFFHGLPDEKGYSVMAQIDEEEIDGYMPRELLNGDAGRYTDVYSIGVLIYELFTGLCPLSSPYELDRLGGEIPKELLPSAVNPSLPIWFNGLVKNTIQMDPQSLGCCR